MKISVIGAGYVGLITGACFAKLGNAVIIIDVDKEKVEAIGKKIPLFYEEHLDGLLNEVYIEASSDFDKITDSEIIFICVGTPCNDEGIILLEQMEKAVKEISQALKSRKNKVEYCVVCVKSTVPPGTTEDLIIPILAGSGKKLGRDLGVCMSPEFLREGKAIYDFMNPARIIVGEYDKRSGDTLINLYNSFSAPILRTNIKTAEMIKLASNAFLATKISFINEVGNICKDLVIDVYEVAEGIGLDDRIGRQFLNAGIGFGGSCLPKDLRGLIAKSRQIGYKPQLLQEVLNLNSKQAQRFIELLRKHVCLRGATVGVLGLAFKAGTDDVRDSTAIPVINYLLEEGAKVKAYDPMAVKNFEKLFPQIEYTTKTEVLNSDAILIVTEWEEFSEIDYNGKIVIDGRRIKKAEGARIYEGICW
ncbi:UDP-glucose dehydrogenase family protein [Chloroflexota bacterium]